MKPHYTKTGLEAYRRAVPLPLPLPPGDPADWTCLYTLLGGIAFRRESYQEAASPYLLRELLELAGRPCGAEECRDLLLVTPMPGDITLIALLERALHGRHAHDAARLLGFLEAPEAVPLLLSRVGDGDLSIRQEVIRSLGRIGAGAEALLQWDGELDAERLHALVRQGRLPDELPAGDLEPLAAWIPGLDPAAGREVLASLDGMMEPLALVLPEVLARNPSAAADLAEAIAEHVARACDHPVWAKAIAAAGEEVVDPVLEQLEAEDWRTRMGATIVLGHLEEAGERGLEALRRAVVDDDADVRREAGLALGLHGEPMRVETWSDSHGFLGRAGVHPWGAALSGGPVPVGLFGLMARRDGAEVMARCCFALAFAHPELAAPALEALARDSGYNVPLEARQAASAALLSTGAVPRALPALHRVLLRGVGSPAPTGAMDGLASEDLIALAARDGDWQVRLAALAFLERTGEAPRFDGLLAMIAEVDSDNDVRDRARALRRPEFQPQGVEVALSRLVVSSRVDDEIRVRALGTLASLAPELADAIALSLFEHPHRSLAVLAGRIAGRSATGEAVAPRVVAALGQLRSHDWIRRETAAALLGSADPHALDGDLYEELVEQLEAASTADSDSDVQRMAAWAAAELRRKRT